MLVFVHKTDAQEKFPKLFPSAHTDFNIYHISLEKIPRARGLGVMTLP